MSEPSSGSLIQIDTLADVPIEVEVRLGCRAVTLDEMARLEAGSAIPLGMSAGTALEIFAGNLLVASAEPAVIENRLAVRITDMPAR